MPLSRFLFVILPSIGICVSLCSSAYSVTPEVDWVKPISPNLLAASPSEERTRVLMEKSYDSIRQWGYIVRKEFQPVPGNPNQGYYGAYRGDGRKSHIENHIRPIAYAAMVNAFLSEVQPPKGGISEKERLRFRQEAIAALRYLTQSHVTIGATTLGKKPWGNPGGLHQNDYWQTALWSRTIGMAAWIIWPHLDEDLQMSITHLIAHEADLLMNKKPKSSLLEDTGAEENSWNAMHLTLACNMMPNHPHAVDWEESAKKYMYNSLSVAADHKDKTLGDDNRPISEWVTTINAHPDFTVENHRLFHIGYLKLTVANLLESAAPYFMTERQSPVACTHHVRDAFGAVLLPCMSWDGAAIYVGGNDWKIVHTQCSDMIIYSMLSLLSDDRRAAYLEEVSLDRLWQIQQTQQGYYNIRRDLEYGGICSTRLITCYLAHAVLGGGVQPLSETEFNQVASGVLHLKNAETIIHRTPTKFASFHWGAKRMALSLPRNGSWVNWPHFSSYLGNINGENSSKKFAKLTSIHHDVQKDRFAVIGKLDRFQGKIEQEFSFASLPNDVTIYIERIKIKDKVSMQSRETGIVGLEYELGSNNRELFGHFGKKQILGIGGKAKVHKLETDWLNIDNRVGYVVLRPKGPANVMRIHDESNGSGRVPKLQEWISLIGEHDPATYDTEGDWVCLITFLNQSADDTARWAERVKFKADGSAAKCSVGKYEFRVDFQQKQLLISELAR